MAKKKQETLTPEILSDSKFYVGIQLDGSKEIDGYFMECQGFKVTQEIIEIAEVSPQSWGQKAGSQPQAKKGRVLRTKIPGNLKTDNITLRRGLSISMTVWNWFARVAEGQWAGDGTSRDSQNGKGQRFDGHLVIYDQSSVERARFVFSGAWPMSYKIGDLKVSNKDFEIEEVELAIDSFKRVQYK